ncbi:MAG: hypothetical protein ACI8R0_002823 [Alteromonadales bacterium]|jgi:hypothetical protein|tara:strand:- start:11471 stop:11638 length:168 start_codon:yes stop_codon:yes gene_type:complete
MHESQRDLANPELPQTKATFGRFRSSSSEKDYLKLSVMINKKLTKKTVLHRASIA